MATFAAKEIDEKGYAAVETLSKGGASRLRAIQLNDLRFQIAAQTSRNVIHSDLRTEQLADVAGWRQTHRIA